MATHDGTSDDATWLSADDVAALSGGRVTAGTVRGWWRSGALAYEVFPELGKKSNKRSRQRDVETFLIRRYGRVGPHPGAHGSAAPAAADARPAAEDLVDTLLSVKAAAAAAMESLITEAEAHAAVSRAVAEADAKRVESLRHLQTMMRGYDLALGAYVQPRSPAGLQQPGR